MDLRLGPTTRVRILPRPEDSLRAVMEQGPRAEALAVRWVERTRPAWSWLVLEWRRLGTVAAVALILGLMLHAMFGANGMVAYRQKRAETQSLKTEVELLQKENEESGARIKALKSDPKAIEREAREQFGYARPGEVVYVAPAPPPKPPTGRAKSEQQNLPANPTRP
ncbi:MAG: septum formation initiator family protein [Acidobacteriia bacterium]|nr:septum formation initiator family protein [Terriglobia bacterium]